ncbi:hypothetical protein WICPIJ_000169 [Wickerhamomyces pijperi]|uniref:Manganese transporter SMF1 n=1 Tax=Wickerhamomyces pijperi TaxID=599730 RepID=A0A9P8TR41_WICPI|nr:hypothetical protein WICPIJ_000169 [Wickerhamomyces pijperi]
MPPQHKRTVSSSSSGRRQGHEFLSPEETLQYTILGGIKEQTLASSTERTTELSRENSANQQQDSYSKDHHKPSSSSNPISNYISKFKQFFKPKPNDPIIIKSLKKYLRFVGPGLMVSVAYMDPGNYSTGVYAGASQRYSLLFIVLLSNIIAIFLQSLCIKLGSVTGLDLSRACREYLPRWLNLILWFFAECAIIATDVAEVIGMAIALNILLKVPLPAGVCISIVDVLFVLMAYRPGSSLNFVRMFEYGVALLVVVVVICFCLELAYLKNMDARQLFRGFAPSAEMFQGNGMYIAVSVLGATVMPHSLFLGSGLVQPRLREFDQENGYIAVSQGHNDTSATSEEEEEDSEEAYYKYRPTIRAIKYAMKYSIIELAVTLFSFALFVNCAILIVSASSLYGTSASDDVSLYSIYDLLSSQVSKAAGKLFMVALLFSGQSAGIVCTIAGQIVSEGHLRWTIKPWKRRIATRAISIVPCLAISLSIGKSGLDDALNGSQVVLSILLPFLTAPLIYFTSKKSIMRVEIANDEDLELTNIDPITEGTTREEDGVVVERKYVNMANSWITTGFAFAVWLFISVLNVYMIVKLGLDHGLS